MKHTTMRASTDQAQKEHAVAYYDEDRGVGDTYCGLIITGMWVGPRWEPVTCRRCKMASKARNG